MKIKINNIIILSLGAILYPLIEIIYRGYSHISMMIVGAIAFFFVYHINITLNIKSPIFRALFSAFCIVLVELGSGIIINRYLNLNVWDYSGQRFSFLNQICLKYAILWFLLSLIADKFCRVISRFFD